MIVAEKRQLKMNPKLLLDVIGRQAGSLDKAILEGGMNCIEAINALEQNGGVCKDKSIRITYDKSEKAIVTISDSGKGITTKKEIENFFETFGTPHDENEHKIYAQFRMGRGQMFNFGKNIWRTGTFELIVDVLNNGLEWELKENLPFVKGCHITIELYDKYVDSWPAQTVDSLKDSVKKQMEFVSIPVFFNGDKINTPPQNLKWDYEDDFAYYSFNIGKRLQIYNLGVFVTEEWGTNGIIVSKHQLKVNFPRNDIMADCAVWYHINKVIKDNIVIKSKKKSVSLSPQERFSILENVRNGTQRFDEIKVSRIFQTAQDKYISFSMFLKNNQPWTIAKIGDRKADTLIQKGSHIVFAREMLDALNYSGEDKNFFNWLIKVLIIQHDDSNYDSNYDCYFNNCKESLLNKVCFFEEPSIAFNSMSSNYLTVANNKITKVEKRVINTLQNFNCWNDRYLRIGISEEARAWTDGSSYINIDRKFLKELNFNNDTDIALLFAVLVHELSHDNNTQNTDTHNETFYETFHELCHSNYHNPMSYILRFRDAMYRAMRNDRFCSEKKKQEKELAEKAKKLGLTVS